MEIRILGPLEVVAEGDPVDLPSGKARLLLAALVVRADQVVSTDRLFEFLWRGQPPESAANTLQTYVWHLRRSLEPDRMPHKRSRLVITREPGYPLAVDRDQIDVVRFERLVGEARAAILRQDPELDWPWASKGLAPLPVPVPHASAEHVPLPRELADRLGLTRALGWRAWAVDGRRCRADRGSPVAVQVVQRIRGRQLRSERGGRYG